MSARFRFLHDSVNGPLSEAAVLAFVAFRQLAHGFSVRPDNRVIHKVHCYSIDQLLGCLDEHRRKVTPIRIKRKE